MSWSRVVHKVLYPVAGLGVLAAIGLGVWWLVTPHEYRGSQITPELIAETENRMRMKFPPGAEFRYLRVTRFPDHSMMLKVTIPTAEGAGWMADSPFAHGAMSPNVNAIQMNHPPPEWDAPQEGAFISGVVKLPTGLLAVAIVDGANGTSTIYLKLVDGITFATPPAKP